MRRGYVSSLQPTMLECSCSCPARAGQLGQGVNYCVVGKVNSFLPAMLGWGCLGLAKPSWASWARLLILMWESKLIRSCRPCWAGVGCAGFERVYKGQDICIRISMSMDVCMRTTACVLISMLMGMPIRTAPQRGRDSTSDPALLRTICDLRTQ